MINKGICSNTWVWKGYTGAYTATEEYTRVHAATHWVWKDRQGKRRIYKGIRGKRWVK